MNSREEKERALHSDTQSELESPFLKEELFVGESEVDWEARLAALEAECVFQRDFSEIAEAAEELEDYEGERADEGEETEADTLYAEEFDENTGEDVEEHEWEDDAVLDEYDAAYHDTEFGKEDSEEFEDAELSFNHAEEIDGELFDDFVEDLDKDYFRKSQGIDEEEWEEEGYINEIEDEILEKRIRNDYELMELEEKNSSTWNIHNDPFYEKPTGWHWLQNDARDYQNDYTSVLICQDDKGIDIIKYRHPVPKSNNYPFKDIFKYSDQKLAERRAMVLRSYGYIVEILKPSSGKWQVNIKRLQGGLSKPTLPSTGQDQRFYFSEKKSAETRAESLKIMGYKVKVQKRTDGNWEVFIDDLPGLAFFRNKCKGPSKASRTSGRKPSSAITSASCGPLPGTLTKWTSADGKWEYKIRSTVKPSFDKFETEVQDRTGIKLSNYKPGGTFRALDRKPDPTHFDDLASWHKTGRTVDLSQELHWLVLKEKKGNDMYFRIYLLPKDQNLSPDGTYVKTLSSAELKNKHANDTRLSVRDLQHKIVVDITALAEANQWKRIPAQNGWEKNWNRQEWWHYERTDNLTWYDALKEIYTEDCIKRIFKKFFNKRDRTYQYRNRFGARFIREGMPEAVINKIFKPIQIGNLTLRLPVGKGPKAANLKEDVQEVQEQLINAGMLLQGSNTGKMDKSTQEKIERFQKDKAKIEPDGLIEVGGKTQIKLAEFKPSNSPSSQTPSKSSITRSNIDYLPGHTVTSSISPANWANEKYKSKLQYWWNDREKDGNVALVGTHIRNMTPKVFPGVPPEAIFGFCANGNIRENTTTVIPSQRFHEIGLFGTEAGSRKGPAPSRNHREDHNSWGKFANLDQVKKLLDGRSATMIENAWKKAIDDQVAVGLINLRERGKTVAKLLPLSIQPDTTSSSIYHIACCFMGWSAGAKRTREHLQLFENELRKVPEHLRWGVFLKVLAEGIQKKRSDLNLHEKGHKNPAWSALRTWQKLTAGLLLAKNVGGNVQWFDIGLNKSEVENIAVIITNAGVNAKPRRR